MNFFSFNSEYEFWDFTNAIRDKNITNWNLKIIIQVERDPDT
jgi:hypothetical protein